MDEGILEVDVAGDRVIQLRGVGLVTCEWEVIVQGDEGPFFAESHKLLIVMESPSVIRRQKKKR